MRERLTSSSQIFFSCALALTFFSAGCALQSSGRVDAPPVNSGASSVSRFCPDRVQRASTGGFVSGVVGTVAASLIGSPLFGGVYQLAGYVIGFTSADTCRKGDAPLRASPLEEKSPPSMASKIEEKNL